MPKLTNKVAVVTGGSKGIGLGIAKRLVADGAKVVICSNEKESLGPALSEIGADPSIAFGVEANVISSTDMNRLIVQTVERFGGVDILANVAGIQRYGTVTDTSEETWDEVFNVNVKGVFLAAKYAVPEMAKRGCGAIINIASVQAFASQDNVVAYTATKGAIVAMTRAMALDHAKAGIRVNVICPASIDTPMLRWAADLWKGNNTAAETVQAWGKAHPIGRIGTTAEIGAIASLLASNECTFMTGADIKVDGGVLSKLGILLPE